MEIINLNLIPGKAWPVAHATQFDKGREFRANLFEGSQVYTLAGDETVDAIIKKPDGNQVTEALVNTADNYVIVTTTEQMTAVAGPSLGEIRISKGDTVIGSLKFILECEQSADTGIESHSEIHNVEAQVAAIVADQYAAEDVVFDNTPTAGHGVGFAVTSEGVKTYVDDKAYALDDLTDVEISAPSNNDVLQYDANAGEWINAPVTPVVDAENVSYDNTASGMTADDVQEAIDELDTDIGDLSALTTSVTSSLVGAVNEVVRDKANKTLLNDIIKIKYFTLPASNVTQNMDISSNLVIDSGYKFLAYMPTILPDGFTTDQYLWLSAPQSKQGYPWWKTNPIAGAGTGAKLRFFYLEIRDV